MVSYWGLLYKKTIAWKCLRTLTPLGSLVFLGLIDLLLDSDEYGDEFLRKIDEDDAKQKKEKK